MEKMKKLKKLGDAVTGEGINRWALLAYAGKQLGYTSKELSALFGVSGETIRTWGHDTYDKLKYDEICDFAYSERQVTLKYVDPSTLENYAKEEM